jgi:hypothetical protein
VRPLPAEYLRKLRALERGRPAAGGDPRQFADVALYREGVVRLSLGLIAAAAFGDQTLDEAVRAMDADEDFKLLFRIVMQCQIIDDVLDYSEDSFAGLPSFLTASGLLPQAFELTRRAAAAYADDHDLVGSSATFPLRSALFLVSTLTRLVILMGRWRHRLPQGRAYATEGLELRTSGTR